MCVKPLSYIIRLLDFMNHHQVTMNIAPLEILHIYTCFYNIQIWKSCCIQNLVSLILIMMVLLSTKATQMLLIFLMCSTKQRNRLSYG